jgi:hypothetical protein
MILNPNAQISNFTFLGKNLKNMGLTAIWADSSYRSTHIFQNNLNLEKHLSRYSIIHLLEKTHILEFRDLPS